MIGAGQDWQDNEEKSAFYAGCAQELALASRKTSAVLSSRGEPNAPSLTWEDPPGLPAATDVAIPSPLNGWLLRAMIDKVRATDLQPRAILGANRSPVLDWMIGVLAMHRQSASTFFRAVQLLDGFHCAQAPSRREAQLSACAALSLVSKFDNTHFLQLSSLGKAAARYRLSREEILARQFELAATLGVGCERHTVADLVEETISLMELDERGRETVLRAAVLVLRMCTFSKELWADADRVELTGCCLVFALKILAGLRPDLQLRKITDHVGQLYGIEGENLTEKMRALHSFVVGFETGFPEAKNLRKHHKFAAFL